jgi:hypothetical protein
MGKLGGQSHSGISFSKSSFPNKTSRRYVTQKGNELSELSKFTAVSQRHLQLNHRKYGIGTQ